VARTDKDTWDLASSVGATATMVAGQRALAHREGLIDDPYAEPLVRAVGVDLITRMLDGEISFEDVDPSFTMRLAAEGMAVRTRFFDQLFLDATGAAPAATSGTGAAPAATSGTGAAPAATSGTASGVRQAVILAAGLDARAYRLPWPKGTVVYEIDQPEVTEFKTTTLAGLGAEPTATRRAIAIDLREDWSKALVDNGFDPKQPTAWIAEGLLIYLPSDAQDKLFDDITALSTPGSMLATERVPDVSAFINGRPKEMAEKLKEMGSDVDMADLVYQGERTNVIEHLEQLGWSVSVQSSQQAHAANGFELPEGMAGEEFGQISYVRAVLG
jgi:methyltransferase (TIGR00027 family)